MFCTRSLSPAWSGAECEPRNVSFQGERFISLLLFYLTLQAPPGCAIIYVGGMPWNWPQT